MAQIFSLKNSKFFSGLKKICAIVTPITTYALFIQKSSQKQHVVQQTLT